VERASRGFWLGVWPSLGTCLDTNDSRQSRNSSYKKRKRETMFYQQTSKLGMMASAMAFGRYWGDRGNVCDYDTSPIRLWAPQGVRRDAYWRDCNIYDGKSADHSRMHLHSKVFDRKRSKQPNFGWATHGHLWHRGQLEGAWRADTKRGYGTYTWPDGRRHIGAWYDGKRHGHGTFTGGHMHGCLVRWQVFLRIDHQET